MSSALGLGPIRRYRARRIAKEAAFTALRNKGRITYTEGPDRWDGIAHHRLMSRGQYPRFADCSAFTTWCLWNAANHYGISWDFVNGQNWKGGFTGTQLQHGIPVSLDRLLVGDLVFYNGGGHVAIYVGHDQVITHGRQGDPSLVSLYYWPPIYQARRYIR